jgi:DNA-binding NtrC family response regulator
MSTKRPRIMIVDDEKDILTLVQKFLQRWEYDVEGYSDPILALERFKQETDSFSLVLSDVRMPGLDGVQLAKNMVKINQDVRILMMTAFEYDSHLSDSLPLIRKEDIIKKPFRLTEVCTAVKRRLEQAH